MGSGLITVEEAQQNSSSTVSSWSPYAVVPCCTCGEDSGWRSKKWLGIFDPVLTFSHYCVCCRKGYGCNKDEN